jgi:anti-sigma regulatory factor (Ser/Thr protein kinase)
VADCTCYWLTVMAMAVQTARVAAQLREAAREMANLARRRAQAETDSVEPQGRHAAPAEDVTPRPRCDGGDAQMPRQIQIEQPGSGRDSQVARPGQPLAPRGEVPTGDETVAARADDAVAYLELMTSASAPFWARRHAQAALSAWQVGPETVETAQLVVSELVTNAIKTSGPGLTGLTERSLDGAALVRLTLRRLVDRIIVEVSDNDLNGPVAADADPDSEGGRGLILVQALSKEWGYFFPPAGGKTVYAVMRAEPPHYCVQPLPRGSSEADRCDRRLSHRGADHARPGQRASGHRAGGPAASHPEGRLQEAIAGQDEQLGAPPEVRDPGAAR